MSKVFQDCFGFALLRSVIGLENSRHPLSQSDAKLKPEVFSPEFSRASGRSHVFTLSSDWFLMTFIFVLIGRCDYFGFGFTTLNRKALYSIFLFFTAKNVSYIANCLSLWYSLGQSILEDSCTCSFQLDYCR